MGCTGHQHCSETSYEIELQRNGRFNAAFKVKMIVIFYLSCFAGIPLCLSTAALQCADCLYPAVPLHLLDAEPAVSVGSALYVAVPGICGVAV